MKPVAAGFARLTPCEGCGVELWLDGFGPALCPSCQVARNLEEQRSRELTVAGLRTVLDQIRRAVELPPGADAAEIAERVEAIVEELRRRQGGA